MADSPLHYGDRFTLNCRVVNVVQHPNFNDIYNVRFEVLDASGEPTTEFSCKATEIAPIGVAPMTADELSALDAADAKAHADELAASRAANRHPNKDALTMWKDRVNSL